MKVSGFTFLRNVHRLGFPFVESIKSLLPIVDEFIINVGKSDDDTLSMVREINDPKIKIIETVWNDHMRVKGFVYGQQKMIAQYACTGDWAFYLEADEIIHEKDYANITHAMEKYRHDPNVESLIFDYLHFYGNMNTYAWTPRFYRRAPRIIKTSVRSYAPDGLFWVVFDVNNKKGRYPKAALANATIHHYGWVRQQSQMIDKITQTEHFWNKKDLAAGFDYSAVDALILQEFTGTHPAVIEGYYENASGVFAADPNHTLTKRELKHRLALKLEKLFGWELSKKHYKLVE